MARPSEEISRSNAQGSQKTDANLANDSLHLGGIPAEEYATKSFVKWYHDTKELLLKEYIDSQDLAKLQEAKAYVDTAIRNQDFSNFAKLQDLQSLSASLTAMINQCASDCQNRLNQKIGEVVTDVNANFTDVNSAITQLNNLYTQLFTSVSNGKKKVAAAITDKGVNTANNASFDTMATNIRNINTSGGEIDPNFVNTSDATATSNDIMLGKTAYVKGQKVYGEHEDLDTSDATASANEIFLGETAYVDGQKITGTFINYDTSYPTIGTDTSNANVTANDITLGKSAYAGGQYIVGTANPSPVEEVYSSGDDDYVVTQIPIGLTTYPNTTDEVTRRYCIEFSKDCNYCVSGVQLNGSTDNKDFYIESHRVTTDGLIIDATAGTTTDNVTYKKYRYSKSELGIGENEALREILLGAGGVLGDNSMCLLLIRTNSHLHFYSYHLSENGVIGKSYNAERYIINNYKDAYYSGSNKNFTQWAKAIFSNTNPYKLFAFSDYSSLTAQTIELSILPTVEGDVVITLEKDNPRLLLYGGINHFFPGDHLQITLSDKYIMSGGYHSSYTVRPTLVKLDNYLEIISATESSGKRAYIALEAQNIKMTIGYNNAVQFNNKTVNLKYDENNSKPQFFGSYMVTPDEEKLIVILCGSGNFSSYSFGVAIYDISSILAANDGDSVLPIQKFNIPNTYTSIGNSFSWYIQSNNSGTRVLIYPNTSNENFMYLLSTNSSGRLVGINYNGQFFRSTQSGVLTATPSDVISGKTFIGNNGTVQTGTYEIDPTVVEEEEE